MSVEGMSEADVANELMRLARAINRANKLYHAEDAPEIPDAEYDALVRRNAELEAAFPHLVRADSPTNAIGHEVSASPLSKVAHEVRMMSLDNAFSDEDVGEFVARVRRFLALRRGRGCRADRRGQDRRAVLFAALRTGRAGAGRDARRRGGGRGCDRECSHDTLDSPALARQTVSRGVGGARRGVDEAL